VQCWDLRVGGEAVQGWDLAPAACHCLALDPAGLLLTCARGDGLISLLDTSPHAKEWTLSGHKEECVWSLVFSLSADSLLSSAADGSVVVWR
jgi:WD40 repeat protein